MELTYKRKWHYSTGKQKRQYYLLLVCKGQLLVGKCGFGLTNNAQEHREKALTVAITPMDSYTQASLRTQYNQCSEARYLTYSAPKSSEQPLIVQGSQGVELFHGSD